MTLLASQTAAKQELVRILRGLADHAARAGLTGLAADLSERRLPALQNERFHLVVLGEFNRGKSTLCNALLGAEILPTGVTPTTTALTLVEHAAETTARLVFADGSKESIPPGELRRWTTGTPPKPIVQVEVGHPAPLLADNVVLVDTPGVNDLSDQRAEITYGFLPRADAILFLLDSGQALTESERAFLETRLLDRARSRLIFCVSRADLLTPAEQEQVLTYLRGRLGALVPDPAVFAVSPKQALAGAPGRGGLDALLAHLSRMLETDRARLLLDGAAAEGLAAAGYLRRVIGLRRQALGLPAGDLGERLGRVKAELGERRRSIAGVRERVRAEAAGAKARVRQDLDDFAAGFARALPGEIATADASDIRRFLPPFIQDKFAEWAEAEGALLAATLEHIAEEAIAVTSESAAQATGGVRLQPGDGRLDVEVDTFKYDVSVYALGALGTTVFLFVNTLVGGLLALSAPILAIVFQGKVEGEIRQQATRLGPEAIAAAAKAIAPRFDAIVDEFAGHLDAFVAGAGDRLFADLGDVLTRVQSERAAKDAELGPLVAVADKEAAAVAESERRLGELRAALWS